MLAVTFSAFEYLVDVTGHFYKDDSLSDTFRPHVELVNILLGCGEEVRVAITRRIHAQCEQNWGALCASLSLCLPDHSRIQTVPTVTPVPAISSTNFLPRAKSPLSQHDVQKI